MNNPVPLTMVHRSWEIKLQVQWLTQLAALVILLLSGNAKLALATVLGCKMRSGSTCICDMSDGSGYIDLTPISNTGDNPKPFFRGIIRPKSTSKYAYNPCKGFHETNCKGYDNAVCSTDSFSLTNQTGAKFRIAPGKDPEIIYKGVVTYVYATKKLVNSTIRLVCDKTVDHTMIWDKFDNYNYKFILTSKHVCIQKPTIPTQPPTTQASSPSASDSDKLSLGTVLDIIFIIVVVVYFTVGYAYMYRHRGARGLEAVPNSIFWCRLPGLIKDGFQFIAGKITSKSFNDDKSNYDTL